MTNNRQNVFTEINTCFLCKNSKIKKIFTHTIQNLKFQIPNSLSNYLNNQTIKYYQCQKCFLVFLSPVFKEEILNQYYASQTINFNRNKNAYLKILKQILKYKTKGNFLDVGSAAGELIELAKDKGFNPFSVEMS